jgi:hypothetical protein
VQLVKPHLDVGLFCRNMEASRAFHEESIGLPYEELLEVGGDIYQHGRHAGRAEAQLVATDGSR